MDWQPISTAPENMSVLVFIPNADHYGPGVYRAILANFGSGKYWITTGRHVGRAVALDDQPTHWMPLPEPPKVSEDARTRASGGSDA